jgi:hypothetical protein
MNRRAMTPLTSAVAVAACLLGAAAGARQEFPSADISNGRIRAKLYLPDPQNGYYRATRFDWSGAIASLEWNGHTFFGQWFQRHDPKIHDAITGPVEEFSSVGYDEAKTGDRFIRIGVGAIQKPDEPRYRQFSTYDIADGGKWTSDRRPDTIEFTHELGDNGGYAYVYRKKVSLRGDTLVLDHSLRNTGRKPIATTVYDHDFFMIDNQPTSPDFVVRFPFEPKAVSPLNDLVEIRGREFRYLKEFQPRQSFQTELTGFGATARDYDFRVENSKTGAGVRQTSDRPLSKINVWAPRTTVCPEGFIDLRVEPGRQITWRITYQFYRLPAPGTR